MAKRTVYVLGAGASVCAGAPTTASFRHAALSTLEAIPAQSPGRNKLKEAMYEWDQFPHLNVEEYYVLADLKEMLSRGARAKEVVPDIEVAKQGHNVRYLITKTITRALENANTSYHDQFVRQVWANAEQDGRNVTIITTNWDILVDNAVRRFKEKQGQNGPPILSYGPLDERGPPNMRGPRAPQASFKVLKLHGSLNWWYCEEHLEVDASRDTKDQDRYYETGHGPPCPTTPEGAHDMEPFFIPPSAQKFDPHGGPGHHMARLWDRARQEIHQAQRLVFIGYSFPDLDVQFRVLVIQALKQNSHIEEILIVTSKKLGAERLQFEERIRTVLGGLPQYEKVRIEDCGFEGWLKPV